MKTPRFQIFQQEQKDKRNTSKGFNVGEYLIEKHLIAPERRKAHPPHPAVVYGRTPKSQKKLEAKAMTRITVPGTEFLIEKDVPLPENERVNGYSKYPYHLMKKGDSFVTPYSIRTRISVSMAKVNKDGKKRFISRKLGQDRLRIWRVK